MAVVSATSGNNHFQNLPRSPINALACGLKQEFGILSPALIQVATSRTHFRPLSIRDEGLHLLEVSNAWTLIICITTDDCDVDDS